MTGEKTNKPEEVGLQPAKTNQEPPLVKRAQQERDRRFQEALEDDEVQEALKDPRALRRAASLRRLLIWPCSAQPQERSTSYVGCLRD
jgi:hypothetical protein